jgi:hypothetical protein
MTRRNRPKKAIFGRKFLTFFWRLVQKRRGPRDKGPISSKFRDRGRRNDTVHLSNNITDAFDVCSMQRLFYSGRRSVRFVRDIMKAPIDGDLTPYPHLPPSTVHFKLIDVIMSSELSTVSTPGSSICTLNLYEVYTE